MFCYKYLSKNFSILLFLVLYTIKQIQTTLYHNYNKGQQSRQQTMSQTVFRKTNYNTMTFNLFPHNILMPVTADDTVFHLPIQYSVIFAKT